MPSAVAMLVLDQKAGAPRVPGFAADVRLAVKHADALQGPKEIQITQGVSADGEVAKLRLALLNADGGPQVRQAGGDARVKGKRFLFPLGFSSPVLGNLAEGQAQEAGARHGVASLVAFGKLEIAEAVEVAPASVLVVGLREAESAERRRVVDRHAVALAGPDTEDGELRVGIVIAPQILLRAGREGIVQTAPRQGLAALVLD